MVKVLIRLCFILDCLMYSHQGGSVKPGDFGSLMKGLTADMPEHFVQTLQSLTGSPIDFVGWY